MKYRKKLQFLISRSNGAYKNYQSKPIYLNALMIKTVNEEVIKLLLEKGHHFENEVAVNILLDHFLSWYFQFLAQEKLGFELSDRFVFNRMDGATAYPKKEIEQLLSTSL